MFWMVLFVYLWINLGFCCHTNCKYTNTQRKVLDLGYLLSKISSKIDLCAIKRLKTKLILLGSHRHHPVMMTATLEMMVVMAAMAKATATSANGTSGSTGSNDNNNGNNNINDGSISNRAA